MPGPWDKYSQPQGPWAKYGQAPPPEQTPVVSDVAKSFGVSPLKAISGLIGFPRDMGSALGEAATHAIDKYVLGKTPEEIAAEDAAIQKFNDGRFNPLPTGQQVRGAIEKVTGPLYEPKTTAGQFADTIGQFATTAPLAGSGSMLSRLGIAASAGAGSELGGQALDKLGAPELAPYARLVGAMIGGGAPSLAKRAVTPFPIDPARQQAIGTLAKEGVELTAGQKTGSNTLRYMESELGGGPLADKMTQQGEQFTAAALRRAGVNADRATPDVMAKAYSDIGNRFDALAARNSIKPGDAQLGQDVVGVVRDYTNLVSPGARIPAVQKFAGDVVNYAKAGMSGEQYKALRSDLSKIARQTSDPEAARALRGLSDAIDDSMERNIATSNPADAGAWADVRHQYRNMITLEQAAKGAGENAAQGIISPAQLKSAAINKQGTRAYVTGKGDFADLARSGEATMKPMPQSGTAPRAAIHAVASALGAASGAMFNGASGAATGAALGGIAGPLAAGRVLMSKPVQRYLANQLMHDGPSALSASRQAVVNAILSGQLSRE